MIATARTTGYRREALLLCVDAVRSVADIEFKQKDGHEKQPSAMRVAS